MRHLLAAFRMGLALVALWNAPQEILWAKLRPLRAASDLAALLGIAARLRSARSGVLLGMHKRDLDAEAGTTHALATVQALWLFKLSRRLTLQWCIRCPLTPRAAKKQLQYSRTCLEDAFAAGCVFWVPNSPGRFHYGPWLVSLAAEQQRTAGCSPDLAQLVTSRSGRKVSQAFWRRAPAALWGDLRGGPVRLERWPRELRRPPLEPASLSLSVANPSASRLPN